MIASRAHLSRPGALPDGSAELRERVMRFLHMCNVPCLDDVRATAEEGIVTLEGQVESAHDRWLCTNCTRRVAGVHQVIDRLHVNGNGKLKRRPR